MADAKHAVAESVPMAEALELHYKQKISDLEAAVAYKDETIKKASMALQRFEIRLKEKEAYIEELRTALVEMTVKATMGGAK